MWFALDRIHINEEHAFDGVKVKLDLDTRKAVKVNFSSSEGKVQLPVGLSGILALCPV